jgi:hypothetical protein
MEVTAGNPNRLHRPLRVADVCQAIANGQIVPAVADGCYQISSQDLRILVEAPEEQHHELPASLLLLGLPPTLDEASDMSCLA